MKTSDKAAASFDLGSTMVALMASKVLGHPFLTHLETYLEAIGQKPKGGKHADFVSTVPTTGEVTGLFEAKGRDRPFGLQRVMRMAKLQLDATPITAPVNVAAIAYFRGDHRWCALLSDPPEDSMSELDPDVVFFLHYRSLVAAMIEAGADRRGRIAATAEIGRSQFTVPRSVFDAVDAALLEGRNRVPGSALVFERASGEASDAVSAELDRKPSVGEDLVIVTARSPGTYSAF
jgi:hypothetical protein